MVEIDNWQDPELSEAIMIWSGFGSSSFPRRDDSLVQQRFGADAEKWISSITLLADEFYKSDANIKAKDVGEMWSISISEFKSRFPDVPDEIAKALAWCYTFDNR